MRRNIDNQKERQVQLQQMFDKEFNNMKAYYNQGKKSKKTKQILD